MSATIHRLHGTTEVTAPGEAVECVVECAERLLALAKDGQLRGLAVIEARADGHYYTDWAHDATKRSEHAIGAGIVGITFLWGRASAPMPEEDADA